MPGGSYPANGAPDSTQKIAQINAIFADTPDTTGQDILGAISSDSNRHDITPDSSDSDTDNPTEQDSNSSDETIPDSDAPDQEELDEDIIDDPEELEGYQDSNKAFNDMKSFRQLTPRKPIPINIGTDQDPRELFIGADLSTSKAEDLTRLLREYSDVFAWS